MTDIYECRGCGTLSTQRHRNCPACDEMDGPGDRQGSAYRPIDLG